MEKQTYYLTFTVDRIPDLTLTKYSVLDGSSVDDIMDKHGVFLRQLHRLGSTAGVYFHLLYYYDPDIRIQKGHHLSVVFYATSTDRKKLSGIREFLTTSVLSTYYDFHCYEISTNFQTDVLFSSNNPESVISLTNFNSKNEILSAQKYVFAKKIKVKDDKLFLYNDKNDESVYEIYDYSFNEQVNHVLKEGVTSEDGMMFICYYTDDNKITEIQLRDVQCVIDLINIAGNKKIYGIGENDVKYIDKYKKEVDEGLRPALTCEIASDGDAVLSFNALKTKNNGQLFFSRRHVLAQKMYIKDEKLWLFEGLEKNSLFEVFDFRLKEELVNELKKREFIVETGKKFICYFDDDKDMIVDIGNSASAIPYDKNGNVISISPEMEKKFPYAAFLTKKDYYLPAQNLLNTDDAGEVHLYSIMEWEPCEDGRLYNVLKLMEGYDRTVALRIDIFPVEHTQTIRQMLPYAEMRRRISERKQGKDDNSENIVRSWDKYLQNLMKFPQFFANVVAFADSKDIAVMLADSVAAEAVESGTYLIENDFSQEGFSLYYGDSSPLNHLEKKEEDNYVAKLLSLYTLEEIRPMFSFPILYPGESIECLKETDPKPFQEKEGEAISLGISSLGYTVDFPIKLFKKHAFIAGVPGAGKTNTMLHLVTSLWRDSREKIPFLVLEPAKQEYRALANISGMEELRIFSPGADTYFPLHINPFQFPVGLTLAEHIANLNAVFAGAFELPAPSPHFIDTCIEKVYLAKGWNVNERNELDENGNYRHEFPTLQELYESLEVAVKNSHYQGETLGNLQSVLEVRVGSLLKREIGNVYNVRESILKPEEWIDVPAIIELEALGEGPANFMSLLLSTLIRETLKVRKTSDSSLGKKKKSLNHVIFYEEAHNLIGPDTDSPLGDSVDPKISATKYLVKMLAEVRALGEGIVIADQLPTVMAPEVLKNTGLKIAHRITAQDDRSLLGSTMSASPDQLEEQGVFGTGWALIFYEDLLKPYKMKVYEWDRVNRNKEKYESPTNSQLFEMLHKNQVYIETILCSAQIMKEKMEVEYKKLIERANKLKQNIDNEFLRLRGFEKGIQIEEEKQKSKNKEERDVINLQKQKLVYEEDRKRFIQKYSRELQLLCWDYANQYYASITLAKNYGDASNYLYTAAVSGFLTIFESLKSLVDVPELTQILVDETNKIMDDIQKFVSLDRDTSTILQNDKQYNKMIYASAYYWVNKIYLIQKECENKAKRIIKFSSDREQNINDFCEEWTRQFEKFYENADVYLTAVNDLIQEKQNEAKDKYLNDSFSYEKFMGEVEYLTKKKDVIYRALHSFMMGPIQTAFVKLTNEDRIYFLKASKNIRKEYMKIVNYLDGNAERKIFDNIHYKEYREQATVIANIELLAIIEMLHKESLTKIEQINESKNDASAYEKLSWIRDMYVAYFRVYRNYDVERDDYYIILVNFYLEFLEKMMSFGKDLLNQLKDDDDFIYELEQCSKIVQTLIVQEITPKEKKVSWIRIFEKWKNMMNQ